MEVQYNQIVGSGKSYLLDRHIIEKQFVSIKRDCTQLCSVSTLYNV